VNKSLVYNAVVIRVVHIILAIVAAAAAAGIIAGVAVLLTDDVETIVIASVLGVWLTEVALYAARCKVMFNRSRKILGDAFKGKESNTIKRYAVSTLIFALVLGVVLYNLEGNIVNQLTGSNNAAPTEGVNDDLLLLKMGVAAVLLVILLIRVAVRKKYKNKMMNGNIT
jgi:hypothetical protein